MNTFHRSWCAVAILLLALDPTPEAAEAVRENGAGISKIDLPTVLRLAHARNLDIKIARERLAEAQANRDAAIWQALPWVSPGITYLNHQGLQQDTSGQVMDVHKESYAVGPTTRLQLDVGDTLYKSLVTHQLVRAAKYAVASQTQDSVFAAVQSYFDLLKAQEFTVIAGEAVDISERYQAETHNAVEAGIAFRADELRVQVQTERNNLALQQAQQNERTAATVLAEVLGPRASVADDERGRRHLSRRVRRGANDRLAA